MRLAFSRAVALLALSSLIVACTGDDGRGSTTTPTAAPTGSAADAVKPTPGGSVTKGSVDAALGRIDGFVQAEMDHFGVPGVAVAVVFDNQVLFSKGYGVRTVGTTDAVTPDTVFQIASLSKPISATAVAGLVDKHVIAWDDPVHKYAPDLQFSDPYVTEHVTFADLYSHRSGLPGIAGNILEELGYSRAEILARLRLLPLDPFRASYSYSNFGLTAAGDAAAKAAGKSFDDMIDEQLFEPAGMSESTSRYAAFVAEPNRSAIHVKINDRWVVGPTRQPDPQAPAGGVASSLRDVSTWVRLVLDGGTLDGKPVVGEEALAETHVPHIVRPSPPPTTYDAQPAMYGLGWNVETDHLGYLRWAHSGAFSAGAATTAVLLPTEHLGVVVLTNGMPLGIPEIIADEVVDQITTGGQTQDWRKVWYDDRFAHFYDYPAIASPASPTAALPNAAYVGTFRNDWYGDVQVIEQGDHLALVEGPRRITLPLTHVDANTFTSVNAPDESPDNRTPVTFTVVGGKATGLDIGDGDGPGTGQLARG